MSKDEFLNRLKQLLVDIPEEEREEALRYYEDYFTDAYDKTEEELAEKLGTPEQIARQIKLDLYNKASEEGGIYTENGYSNAYYEDPKETPEVIAKQEGKKGTYEQQDAYGQNPYGQNGYESQNAYQQGYTGPYSQQYQQSAPKKNNTALIILLIVTAPIWASVVFGILAAIGGTLFGLVIAAACVFGGLMIAGVICFGAGMGQLFLDPLTGALFLGVSCILVAIALLSLTLLLVLVTKLIPWIIRGIVAVFRKIFNVEGKTQWAR